MLISISAGISSKHFVLFSKPPILTLQKLIFSFFKVDLKVLGIAKLIFSIDLATILLPLYAVGLILTFFSSEEFVNVGWDSAGVTTGPVTVPLVLAMGLGLGNAVSAIEGFGILSLASICPIIAVLTMGLIIQIKNKFAKNEDESNLIDPNLVTEKEL